MTIVKYAEWSGTGQCAQGDVFVRRVDALPDGLVPLAPVNGRFVVAHSETGHDHVLAEGPGVRMYHDPADPMTSYLEVLEATEVTLEHLRAFDTHRPIQFLKGIFRFRRARERTPEGWRRVED